MWAGSEDGSELGQLAQVVFSVPMCTPGSMDILASVVEVSGFHLSQSHYALGSNMGIGVRSGGNPLTHTRARSLQREHNAAAAAQARAAAAPSPQVDAWRRPRLVPTSFCAAPCASEVPGVPAPAPQPAREAGRPEALTLTRRGGEREQRRKSRRVEAPPAGVSGEMEAHRGRTAGPPPGSSSSSSG